jgi:hypothetical protein
MDVKKAGLEMVIGVSPEFWARRLRNPVFIIGCARSGTTLLSDLFRYHRDIANLSEANHIWDPRGYPWDESTGETAPIWIDPVGYTARWWRDMQDHQREIRARFGAYQWVLRKPVFVNKTPLNTFRLPHLFQMFPEAKLIHVVRDGRAVVQSYTARMEKDIQRKPEPYRRLGLDFSREALALQLAWFWQANLDEVSLQDEKLGLMSSGKMMEITYEALCADVQGTLAHLCPFMGLKAGRFRPEMRQMDVTAQNHKWREAFDADLIAQISERMQPALARWGYV